MVAVIDDTQPILSMKGVSITFRAKERYVTALEDINLSLNDGEFVCIVGPSGCGKTTLLRVAAGLITPTSGRAYLDGVPIAGTSSKIGVVFQRPELFPWRTVLKNVLLAAEVSRLKPRSLYEDRAHQLLELVGVNRPQELPANLSGGMQQRVSICRALLLEPEILLMDEPFGALDAMTREYMNAELLNIWTSQRMTALLITHSISEAAFLADRVIVMSSQPGVVLEDIVIDVPRPRTLEMLGAELAPYTRRIRELLGSWESKTEGLDDGS